MKHGTSNSYINDRCRCDSCCAANTRRVKMRRLERLHGIRHWHDATGTRRRIQALNRLGWPTRVIAESAGVPKRTIEDVRTKPDRLVYGATIDGIRRAYAALSMRPGPNKRVRHYAAAMGWPPPLAWDDDTIDDPAAKPAGVTDATRTIDEVAVRRAVSGHAVNLTAAERAEATRILREQGLSYAAVADRLGVTDRSVARIIAKAKAPEQVAS